MSAVEPPASRQYDVSLTERGARIEFSRRGVAGTEGRVYTWPADRMCLVIRRRVRALEVAGVRARPAYLHIDDRAPGARAGAGRYILITRESGAFENALARGPMYVRDLNFRRN